MKNKEKTSFIKHIPIDKKEKKRLKHKLFAFLICLAISFSLWLLFAYSQMGSEYFSFSVKAKNIPPEYLLTGQSVKNVSFHARASVQIVENIRRRGQRIPLYIDFSELKPVNRGSQYSTTLYIGSYLERFLQDLGYNGSIDNISPDSITFFFEKADKKEVPVKLNLQYNIPDQYRQFDPTTIYPEKIFLYGRKSILDTIRFIETQPLNLGMVYDSIDQNISLAKYTQVGLSQDSVRVVVRLGKVTEKQFTVPVTSNFPDSTLEVSFIPDQVTLSCLVPIDRFSTFTADMFTVEAACDSVFLNERIVPLRVEKIPKDVQLMRMNSETVEYIILEK